MPEGAEVTPDESEDEDDAKKLNIDLSDLLVSKTKKETPKEPKQSKKKSKKKRKTKQQPGPETSSDEDQPVVAPVPVAKVEPAKPEPTIISNPVLICENADIAVSCKPLSRGEYEFEIRNKHKSRVIRKRLYLGKQHHNY